MDKKPTRLEVIDEFDVRRLLEVLNSQGDSISDANKERINMLLEIQGVSLDSKPRKDGRWQGRIRVDGEYKSVYGKSKEEVIFKLQKIVKGEKPPTKKKTAKEWRLHEWIDEWYKLYKKPKLKLSTENRMSTEIERLKKLFSDTPLKKMTGLQIQEILSTIPATSPRISISNILNQALAKAVALKILRDNPCAAVEVPAHKVSRKRALTQTEQADFVAAIKDDKFETLFLFLLSTGLRIGEVLALTAADVTKESVSVTKNVAIIKSQAIEQDSPKSRAGIRTVPLSENIYNRLDIKPNTHIFPFPYREITHSISKIYKKIGVSGCSLHTLRHTYATRLDEIGVPAKIRQYLLGHESEATTQNIYTDVQAEHLSRFTSVIVGCFDTENTQK
jgi:integrase